MSRYTVSACVLWSGWGDPWFPHGAVLLLSPAGMALCFLVFSPFICLRPYHDEMTQCCHLLHESANELVASHSSFVGCSCLVFVLFWLFVLLCLFCCWGWRLIGLQVLHQFSFVALHQQTASRVNLEINVFTMPQSVLCRRQSCGFVWFFGLVWLQPRFMLVSLFSLLDTRNAPSCFKSSPETMKPRKAGRMAQTSTWTGEDHFLESKKPMCSAPKMRLLQWPFAKNDARKL